ncbi:MAG: prolipoprotein diacylglyceryl transferase [Oscillospiraceae bacterium]|nr:prolipoprotein diacylglyceryl transferase [Oscillospiraceae bacterium]
MNNQLAYFDNNVEIYWHGIVMALGIALGTAMAGWLIGRVRRGGQSLASLVLVIAFFPSLILSRGMYLFFSDAGGGLFDFVGGGYALYGGIAGVILAALVAALILRDISMSTLLDCLAPGGMLAIAFGRFAAGFSGEELGQQVDVAAFQRAPFATRSIVDGNWYLSVYFFEGVVALAITVVLTAFFFSAYKYGRARRKKGTVATLGAILYTASQSLLESMRTDLLFLKPFNLGFVKTSQLISAIILIVIAIILCVRAWKRIDSKLAQIFGWAVIAGGLTVAFIMEFKLVSGVMVKNYTIMGLCLAAVAAAIITLLMKTSKLSGGGDDDDYFDDDDYGPSDDEPFQYESSSGGGYFGNYL